MPAKASLPSALVEAPPQSMDSGKQSKQRPRLRCRRPWSRLLLNRWTVASKVNKAGKSVVNFINILIEPFLYTSALHSFTLTTVWLWIFLGNRISAQKLLVKCWRNWLKVSLVDVVKVAVVVWMQFICKDLFDQGPNLLLDTLTKISFWKSWILQPFFLYPVICHFKCLFFYESTFKFPTADILRSRMWSYKNCVWNEK